MRKIIGEIIEEEKQKNVSNNSVQFVPTKLTKEGVKNIDTINVNVHHQLSNIEDTTFKKKGCFRCRVKKWRVPKVRSFCVGCEKYICDTCYAAIH